VVDNVNPNQTNLLNVATGGTFSSKIRKIKLIFRAKDAPGKRCDPGEFSDPTPINLKMEDDDGDILIDSEKTVVCTHGKAKNVKMNVFFQSPLNCENSAVPPPVFTNGDVTATASIAGQPDYVETHTVKCFP